MAQRMNNEIPSIPEDIIRYILKRLPVKLLIRLQCVCKHWRNVIRNRSFAKEHFEYSGDDISVLIERYAFNLHLRLLDCRLQVHDFQNPSLMGSSNNAVIVGSCNGLLCAQLFPSSLMLWNPATRACRYVPTRTSAGSDRCVVGFGFSPLVNDYKIVRIYLCKNVVIRVEVFSISSGSWKGIDIGNLKGVNVSNEAVTANGAMFWSGVKQAVVKGKDDRVVVEHTNVVVSFDIANEVFTLIPWPDFGYTTTGLLVVCEDRLAIIHNMWLENGEGSGLIDLLVMKEGAFGERCSWTKTFTSNPFPFKLYPKTIWMNQIVCEAPSEVGRSRGIDFFVLLNLTTFETKIFHIPRSGYVRCMWNYVESLVSPSADH